MRAKLLLPLLLVVLMMHASVASAQSLLACPDATSLKSNISTLKIVMFTAIIAIVLLVLLFNLFGLVSMIAMRLGEFLTERLRFVFELLLIYILFMWGLDPNMIRDDPQTGCAVIDWKALFTNGPLFFRIVRFLLSLLGISI